MKCRLTEVDLSQKHKEDVRLGHGEVSCAIVVAVMVVELSSIYRAGYSDDSWRLMNTRSRLDEDVVNNPRDRRSLMPKPVTTRL